jgi:hypothetical protein
MVLWGIISLFGLYHLLRHSVKDKKAPVIAFIYVAISIFIGAVFINTTSTIDWANNFDLTMPAFTPGRETE